MSTNPKVDFYFKKAGKWQKEIELLRVLALDSGLSEELKWGCPCYMQIDGNVLLIHVFKDYCAILFFKGALFNDKHHLLVQQTKNVQAARQLRFTNLLEIIDQKEQINWYIKEAMRVEKAGLKFELKKTEAFDMPQEFAQKLKEMPALKKAFNALTPGRQRAYLLHFSSAKQSATRISRIEKYMPLILKGKGINDD